MEQVGNSMTIYRLIAENHAHTSENRIHNDDVAARLGFRGALVPGVAVYGYMTHPLVEKLGAQWLSHHATSVRFLKPAYAGDELRIELKTHDGSYEITCVGPRDELLAVLHSRLAPDLQPASKPALFARAPVVRERPEIAWDTVDCERPLPAWRWDANDEENTEYTAQVADFLPIYKDFIHPHWALATANRVLVREFIMPAWIHVGSEIEQYRPFKVGAQVIVQAAPVEKWKKKGHEFVRLAIHYENAEGPLAVTQHTAIFRVAGV